ncbi:MAG: hypothetical protein VKJ02_08620 [Snowella sp.]|nr:hypothetical protein [Snowella sp.]
MKPMIWRPEEKDEKVNQYLDHVNHEPWVQFLLILTVFVTVFSILIFLEVF